MRLVGDVSEKERALAAELKELEHDVGVNSKIPMPKKAQMYVCLAHDWFQLHMEEEGNRLLLKAEKAHPTYFKTLIVEHQKADERFDSIVKNISVELVTLLLNEIEGRKS